MFTNLISSDRMKNILFASVCFIVLFFEGCKFTTKSEHDGNMFSKENDLEVHFKNPPHEARPEAWWWWLQTPTTKDAITLDLEEIKAKDFQDVWCSMGE